MKAAWASALLQVSGACDSLYNSRSKLFGMLGEPFFKTIGQKRGCEELPCPAGPRGQIQQESLSRLETSNLSNPAKRGKRPCNFCLKKGALAGIFPHYAGPLRFQKVP